MTIRVFLFILIFISVIRESHSQQVIFKSLKGRVLDENTKTGIVAAHIFLKNASMERNAISGENGEFEIRKIPVGRYSLYLSHVNYEKKLVRDVLLESGKENYLEVELSVSPQQLDEVVIEDSKGYQDDLQNISLYAFSQEQSQRFAATFYDPARMALTYPGVTATNDQSNNISVRGNAPYTNSWRLQGAEIVNPNHLTNAGTFSDRPSVVGGGVSILSAQLMGNTELRTGAFPAFYGDALGGILDINLKKGNTRQQEYTLQAGLLGLDISTEGPFGKNSDDSYIINYRYSTIGLLQAMGLEVSPESINFQDLSFHTNFNSKQGTEWGVFGILGLSTEKFTADRDSSQWEIIEDRIDTRFTSNMGAVGVTNKIKMGERSSINTVMAISEIQTERTGKYVQEDYSTNLIEQDVYDQGIFTVSSSYNLLTAKNHQVSAGIKINHVYYDLLSQAKDSVDGELDNFVSNKGNYQMFKTFVEWKPIITHNIIANIGAHVLYFDLNDELSVEPRVGITGLLSDRSTLTMNYGIISQSHFPQAYFVTTGQDEQTTLPNMDLGLSKSHQLNLSYSYQLNQLTTFKVEAYWQKHFNVPVSASPGSTYSLLNAVDVLIDEVLINEGTGENKGIEILVNRGFKNGFYFTVSSSLYDVMYTALDGIERNARYDGSYASSITLGKEIQSLKNNKNRIFGVNLRFIWQGGYRHTPIDEGASAESGKTVYVESEAFTLKYDDFIRADIRLYIKKYKEKYTRTLSLDIQNLTGQQNIAYQYFDRFSDQVETKYQLGFLPFLSYRVEF